MEAEKAETKKGSGDSAVLAKNVASGGGAKKWIFIVATVILVTVAVGWTMFGGNSSSSSDERTVVSGVSEDGIVKNATVENVATDQKKVNMYLFWGSTCPHCKAEYEFLEGLSAEEKAKFRVYGFEVWGSDENADLLKKVASALGQEAKGVPYLVIEDEVVAGYLDESTGEKILDIVNKKFDQKDRKDVFINEVIKNE